MPNYRLQLARDGRKNATPAEARLWFHLRDRRLDHRKFVRQKVIGRYRTDFYCHEERLVIELDGSSHDSEDSQEYDLERSDWLEAQGFRVLRFRNEDVMRQLGSVLEVIRGALIPFPE
jgi:very-short-patch-repair endonuclease